MCVTPARFSLDGMTAKNPTFYTKPKLKQKLRIRPPTHPPRHPADPAGLRPPPGASQEREVRRIAPPRRAPLPNGQGGRVSRRWPHGGSVAFLPVDLRARRQPPSQGPRGQRSTGCLRFPRPRRERRRDRKRWPLSGAL